jgi:IS30 family transposase
MVSRASRAALNVLVERKSRYLNLTLLPGKTSIHTRRAIVGRLSAYPKGSRRSITYDNGSENVDHCAVNRELSTRSYFCHPYRSWEKGTVENTAGLVRRFIPKKTDLGIVSELDLAEIEWALNNRPRKCLGFQTPAEVFNQLVGALPP